MANDRHARWKENLIPRYGDRETENMWRWYQEASRPQDLFEEDLKKLMDYYPIQYLTGYSFFYGKKFKVSEHTLIPRPETEELVYNILEDNRKRTNLRVIDLGTGTGCIAITLKMHRPDWSVTGLDNFPQTLNVARENAEFHHAEVKWQLGNMLQLASDALRSYDIVISNPPYIRPVERSSLEKNVVNYEPASALFTGDAAGLEFYEAIESHSREMGAGSLVYLEMNHHTSHRIAGLFPNSRYQEVQIIKDLQGLDRILKVTI